MGLLPNEADIEKAEDHLLVILTQFRKELIADLERILDERQLAVTFRKPGASQ